MAMTMSKTEYARELALEHAFGLEVAGHYSEQWTMPFFKTAMYIVQHGINASDISAVRKAYAEFGVPLTTKSESLVNSIAMKYQTQMNEV